MYSVLPQSDKDYHSSHIHSGPYYDLEIVDIFDELHIHYLFGPRSRVSRYYQLTILPETPVQKLPFSRYVLALAV